MAEAYMNKFLVVNLTSSQFKTVPVPEWLKEDYVGGKGFGAKLLHDLIEKGADPLGPDNPLMFMTGPLTSTAAPSMRACVVCKSPQTGGYLDSFFGGSFGPEIKFAGFDGLIIYGRAAKPVYLWIRDDQIEFRDATPIWGQDTLKSNAWIKKEVGAPYAKVATIGPAGEKKVRFALISCEYNRQAGRGGSGAVMGAKNLKGIAIKGTRLVRVFDADRFQAAVARAHSEIEQSEECRALTDSGTSYAVPWSANVGTLPHKNFFFQSDGQAEKIGDDAQKKHLFLGKAACFTCPIRCSQMGAVRTGRYAHLVTDTVEYESAAMLGANLDIHDIRALAYLTKCCDEFGVDTISMGNLIGFAFEAVEKGLIAPPKGIQLAFGSIEGAEYLIRAVCLEENDLGRLLGRGVKEAALHLGNGAEQFALHVKGLEMPGWAPRGLPGMGLAYMTADRGACHQRGFMVAYEVGGEPYQGKPVSNYGLAQKAEILKQEQDYLAGTDTLVKCDFAAFGIGAECFAELYQAATGKPFEPDGFMTLGERIWNLTRCFNLREGLSGKKDRLPERIVKEPVPEGMHKGQRIRRSDMEQLLADYYLERGWDQNGRPSPATLSRLKINANRIDRDAFLVTGYEKETRE